MTRIGWKAPWLLAWVLSVVGSSAIALAEAPKPWITGLKNPESVAVDSKGRIFVSIIGEFDVDGDGSIVEIVDGRPQTYVSGLNDPKGLVAFGDALFVADKQQVLQVSQDRAVKRFAPANAFPVTPRFLNDLAVDIESGMLYVSDSGDLKGAEGAVYRITPFGQIDIVVNHHTMPNLKAPNGLALDGAAHLLVADFLSGTVHRVKLVDRSFELVAEGLGGLDGLAWDRHGRLFISDWKNGKVSVIGRPGQKPQLLLEGMKSSADLCLAPNGSDLIIPDMLGGTLVQVTAHTPDAPVETSPLPIDSAVAFSGLEWTGWNGLNDNGQVVPLRPIVLTHVGDERTFVATQQGVIHIIEPGAKQTKIFLDISDKVRYRDKTNEEGFLGLAFHPKFKENGQFFVFYTPNRDDDRYVNVISRFKVQSGDKQVGDPKSEEVLLRVEHPFWNHDGGTLAFGKDGMLYIALGDGGYGNDLYDHGQNLETLLGSILRIDVDHKQGDLPYAIPQDNPFLKEKGARGEIWANGFRNVWRFSFDRQTGDCWAADVGQNLWEEINLVTSGGNYGWNRREGLHPFGARGAGVRAEFTDPIWEYHHDTGKSITGGFVYRGKEHPSLVGAYIYADYVAGKLWALRYDAKQKRVVANQPLGGPGIPVLSFGEDARGEVYYLVASPSGEGIYRFVSKKP